MAYCYSRVGILRSGANAQMTPTPSTTRLLGYLPTIALADVQLRALAGGTSRDWLFAITMALDFWAGNPALKKLCARLGWDSPRPDDGHVNGFPSGHAQTMAFWLGYLALRTDRGMFVLDRLMSVGMWRFTVAGLCCAQRVWSGRHSKKQVYGGIFVGSVYSLVFFWVTSFLGA